MQDKLLSTKELSEYLGIAVSTIIEYRMNNRGPIYAKLGHLARDLFFYLLIEKRQKLDYHKTHMQRDKNSISVKKQDKINHAESEENF